MKNKRTIGYSLIVLLVVVTILWTVYSIIDKKEKEVLTSGITLKQFQDIESTGKKWLNGYLGIFFRFKQLGNVSWLIFPLLIHFFITIKVRQRWQIALVFIWLLTGILIGIKGYENFRYQLTLFPFTVSIVLLLLWEFLKNKQKYIKILGYSFFFLICLYNVFHYFENYRFYWDLRVTVKKPHFPYRLINYINEKIEPKENEKVFVVNQALFYYYTDRKGIDIYSPKALPALVELRKL